MLYDVIIIGAGPAGITSAIYAARKGMKVIITCKELEFGGKVINNILVKNYPGIKEITGFDLATRFKEHLKEIEFALEEDEVKNITVKKNTFNIKTSLKILKGKTIIIATGSEPKSLNIEGEEKYKNKGVSYCATCDSSLFFNRVVAIIGGSYTAAYTILQMSSISRKVYAINPFNKFEIDSNLLSKIHFLGSVKIFNNSDLLAIEGNDVVKKIRFIQNNIERSIKVDGVFINVGYTPQSDLVKNIVKINEKSEIIVDSKNMTNVRGIFAAGDCTNSPYKQIIIAAAEGANAALGAFEYISNLMQ
ncbi:MAG: NAD(P)/FAD-dependent oxidoreductase [Nitrososphaeraceae archaeon]